MNASPPLHTALHARSLHAMAPELAGRVGMILDNLKALIAARFLKIPFLLPLLMPLWKRLNRIQRRLRRAMELHGLVRKPRTPSAAEPARARVRIEVTVPLPQPCLPRRFGWLIAALGWEAAGYASHLEHLLSEPDVAAMLAACPRARRVLRPVAHMLRFKLAEPTRPDPQDQIVEDPVPTTFLVSGDDRAIGNGLEAVVCKTACKTFQIPGVNSVQ